MLELGIDEITIVLQLTSSLKNTYNEFVWETVAENVIERFIEKADFETVYGKRKNEKRAPEGYRIAYTFGEHNFYLAVAYHPSYLSMGIIVKFSAQALDFYCEKTGLKVYEFMQKVRDKFYTVRLSRIDLTADYIDEGIYVTEIYQDLMNNRIGIFHPYRKKDGATGYKRVPMHFNGVIEECDIQTTYIGSVQSNSRLKIYDKKREQIERKGTKFDKAVACQNWVRFEGTFRHEYAHQLTEELYKISSNDEFARLIARTLVQKFRLMHIENGEADCETEYIQMLIDCIGNCRFVLKAPSSKNYELMASIRHMFKGSGIMNTFYKAREIWGDDAVATLLDYIVEVLEEWNPNDDCRYWLMKNAEDYKKEWPDFDRLLSSHLLF